MGTSFSLKPNSNKIVLMRPSADGTHADQIATFAQGLVLPHGLAFYPNTGHPQWLYVAETNRVVRYAYKTGDTVASGVPEIVVPQLSPVSGGGALLARCGVLAGWQEDVRISGLAVQHCRRRAEEIPR